ncbi:hypothetical protein [Oleomonas cavernae]|uniref:hypothetical protein n=1 Tax=Oleomonas cavernae TaxID=2320859 RepID=UPI0011C38102|nr:hypothetical protein [Oleomonas cavernae]
MKLGFLTILCLVPLFSGCIEHHPDDLAYASIQSVDWQDQTEMPGPGASSLSGLVDSTTLALMGDSVMGGDKPSRPLLKVEFTSVENLPRFVKEQNYASLGAHAYYCDHPEEGTRLSFTTIYWRGHRLSPLERDGIQRDPQISNKKITYYIYLDVKVDDRPKDIPPQLAFDFRRKPENVCFYLSGGNNIGFGFKSNIVVIPKDKIADALRID